MDGMYDVHDDLAEVAESWVGACAEGTSECIVGRQMLTL